MRVTNVHERAFAAPVEEVGRLLDSLASAGDRLWPRHDWPAMRLDGPLGVGRRGGHGPIRYMVEAYEPGRSVVFRFIAPAGFLGTHAYEVSATDDGGSRLRHVLEMDATGAARLTWPLLFRPMHDALIEDSLDRAGRELGEGMPARAAWSPAVRVLRWSSRLVLYGRGPKGTR